VDARCLSSADLAQVWVVNNDSSACDRAELLMKQRSKIAFECGQLSPHYSRDDSHIQIGHAAELQRGAPNDRPRIQRAAPYAGHHRTRAATPGASTML